MNAFSTHTWIKCWKCQVDFALPNELYNVAHCTPDVNFYCPYGHGAHFPAGDTKEDILRRERNQLRQQLAQKDDEIASVTRARIKAENSLRVAKKEIKKTKTRVSHGVCPCCNRSFEDLARHMASKHKDYAEEKQEAPA